MTTFDVSYLVTDNEHQLIIIHCINRCRMQYDHAYAVMPSSKSVYILFFDNEYFRGNLEGTQHLLGWVVAI